MKKGIEELKNERFTAFKRKSLKIKNKL